MKQSQDLDQKQLPQLHKFFKDNKAKEKEKERVKKFFEKKSFVLSKSSDI